MLFTWIQTLTSFRAYHRLEKASAAKTVLFGLYLLLVGVLIFNIYFAVQLHKRLPPFLAALPAITFEKGMLTKPQTPTLIRVPGADLAVMLDAQAKNSPSQQEFINKSLLAFISGNKLYMPTVAGVQSQPLPPALNAQITPQSAAQYAPALHSLLQTAAFFGSLLALAIFMLCSLLLAFSVVFLWRGLTRTQVSAAVMWRWAVFLQGPALALWLVNLFFTVPLFILGLFILFNIYTQQIFNILLYEQER